VSSQPPPNYPPQGQPYGPYNPGPAQPLPKPKKSRKWLLAGVGGFLLGTIIGCAGGSAEHATTAVPAAGPAPTVTVTQPGKTVTEPGKTVTEKGKAEPAPTVTVTEKAPEPEPTSDEEGGAQDDGAISDGTYLVGDEIKTGKWQSPGVADGEPYCYAQTETEDGDILEQEVTPKGKTLIRITSKAYSFTSSGCGEWKKVG